MHNWTRATCVDDQGKRYPESWTYYECESCGVRTKVFANGRAEAPTDDEWEAHRPRS